MKRLRNAQGQGLVEYLILVALIAVGSIAVMRVVGNSVNVQFSKVAKALGATVEGDLSRPQLSSSAYKKRDLTNFLQGAVGNENRGSAD